jgi:hypothetical protein
MTIFTTQTLLPTTIYDGTTNIIIGTAVPAANYYGGQGSAQTALIQVTGFIGNITLQGTLNDWTEQALWFDIESYGNTSTPTTDSTAINMIGNFVWIRAKVTDFTGGTINSANLVY